MITPKRLLILTALAATLWLTACAEYSHTDRIVEETDEPHNTTVSQMQ